MLGDALLAERVTTVEHAGYVGVCGVLRIAEDAISKVTLDQEIFQVLE